MRVHDVRNDTTSVDLSDWQEIPANRPGAGRGSVGSVPASELNLQQYGYNIVR